MKLVVGLGNPGPRHVSTRHNAGRRVVELLAERAGHPPFERRYEGRLSVGWLASHEVALLLPDTFMNDSGDSVVRAVHALGIELPSADLLIVVDDLDLPLGRLRIRPAGRDGGQRGLRNVMDRLGTEEVPRLRFGVSRPPLGVDPIGWVLEEFGSVEERILRVALPRAADAICCFLEDGVGVAMDRFNGPFEANSADGR